MSLFNDYNAAKHLVCPKYLFSVTKSFITEAHVALIANIDRDHIYYFEHIELNVFQTLGQQNKMVNA